MTLDDGALIALARELPVELPTRAQREEVRTAVLAARARSAGGGIPRRMRVSMLLVGTLASAAGVALALAFPSAPAAAPRAVDPHVIVQVAVPHERVATPPAPPAPSTPAPSPPPAPEPRVQARPQGIVAVTPSPPPAPEPRAQAPLQGIVAVTPSPPPAPESRVQVRPQGIVAVAPLPPPPPPVVPALDELAYDAAWSALRAGDHASAAIGFQRAYDLAPGGPLADDAAYWHCVALARAHRRGEAIAAFRTLIAGAGSVHAGAANAMLGWLLLDDSASRVEAGQRFHAAAEDPDPEVRASSRAGLAAIARGDG